MTTFEGKVVLIVGVGTGRTVGLGIARAFARAGAHVALVGTSKSKLNSAASQIDSTAGGVVCVKCDFLDRASISNAVNHIAEEFGRVDALVNCMQVAKVGENLATAKLRDLDLAVEYGVKTALSFMQECYPYLKQAKGSVINLGSLAALSGHHGQALAAAAKEGLRAMSRVAAVEWAEHDINVNVLCALSETGKTQEWKEESPGEYEGLVSSIPLGRLADAEREVGETCVFLASDAASFMTGQTIELSGGMGLHA